MSLIMALNTALFDFFEFSSSSLALNNQSPRDGSPFIKNILISFLTRPNTSY